MQKSGRTDAPGSRSDAEPDTREKRERFRDRFRLFGVLFVALVGGAATTVAAVAGETPLPLHLAVGLGAFVTVGLGAVFYIEDVSSG